MKNFKTLRRRGFALFVAFIMCLGMLPTTAFAAEDGSSTQACVVPGVAAPKDGDANTYHFPKLTINGQLKNLTIWFSTGFETEDEISVTDPSNVFEKSEITSGTGNSANQKGIRLTVKDPNPEGGLAAYLRDNLTVKLTSDKRDYAICFGSIKDGYAYNPVNGHYYTYVYGDPTGVWDDELGRERTNIDWKDARNAAHKMTYTLDNGQKLQGYLTTITSDQEQRFIENLFKGQFWTAGTRLVGLYKSFETDDPHHVFEDNDAWNNRVWSPNTVDRAKNATDGNGAWFWGDGPELGKIYYPFTISNHTRVAWYEEDRFQAEFKADPQYLGGEGSEVDLSGWNDHFTYTLNGEEIYNCWAQDGEGSEPNTHGNEQCMHVYGPVRNVKTESLRWNDYNCNDRQIEGYLVEFGGYPDEPTPGVDSTIQATAHISLKKGTEVTTVIAETGTTKAAVPASGLASSVSFTPVSKLNGKDITVEVTHDVYAEGQETASTIPGTAGKSDVVAKFIDNSNGYHSYYSIKEVEVESIDLAAEVSCVTEDTKHTTPTTFETLKDATVEKMDEPGLFFNVTTEEYVEEFASGVNEGLDENAQVIHTAAADTVKIQLVLEDDAWTVKVLDTATNNWDAATTQNGKFVVPMAAVCQPVTVTFELNLPDDFKGDEPETPPIQNKYVGQKADKPEQDPVVDNCKFLGWYLKTTSEDGTETYTEYNFDAALTESIILYAQWSQNGPPLVIPSEYRYVLMYDLNDSDAPKADRGEVPPEVTSDKTTDSKWEFTVTDKKPTREGYEFKGWATTSTATSADVEETFTVAQPDAVATIYAVWAKEYTYTLIYDLNDSDAPKADRGEVPENVPSDKTIDSKWEFTVTDEKPTRKGYEFKGWATTPKATSADVEETFTVAQPKTVDTIYAVWEKLTYNVTVNYWNEDVPDDDANRKLKESFVSDPVEDGDSYTIPENTVLGAIDDTNGDHYILTSRPATEVEDGYVIKPVTKDFVIDLYYSLDNNVDDPDGPDNVPDKYQVKVIYKVDAPYYLDGNQALTEKVSYRTVVGPNGEWAKKGTTTFLGVLLNSSNGPIYDFDTWTVEAVNKAGNAIDLNPEFTVFSAEYLGKQNLDASAGLGESGKVPVTGGNVYTYTPAFKPAPVEPASLPSSTSLSTWSRSLGLTTPRWRFILSRRLMPVLTTPSRATLTALGLIRSSLAGPSIPPVSRLIAGRSLQLTKPS